MFAAIPSEALVYQKKAFQVGPIATEESGFALSTYRSVIEHALVSLVAIYQGC